MYRALAFSVSGRQFSDWREYESVEPWLEIWKSSGSGIEIPTVVHTSTGISVKTFNFDWECKHLLSVFTDALLKVETIGLS